MCNIMNLTLFNYKPYKRKTLIYIPAHTCASSFVVRYMGRDVRV